MPNIMFIYVRTQECLRVQPIVESFNTLLAHLVLLILLNNK